MLSLVHVRTPSTTDVNVIRDSHPTVLVLKACTQNMQQAYMSKTDF